VTLLIGADYSIHTVDVEPAACAPLETAALVHQVGSPATRNERLNSTSVFIVDAPAAMPVNGEAFR